MGLIYLSGDEVEVSSSKFVEYMRRSSIQGYPPAKHNLGVLHQKGLFVEKNLKIAEEYYKSAVDLGYSRSLLNLSSTLCANGRDVVEIISTLDDSPFNKIPGAVFNLALYLDQHYSNLDEKVVKLYENSSHMGHKPSTINLILKKFGNDLDCLGKNINYVQTMFNQGNGLAAFYLGNIYLLGKGVNKDVERAFLYYSQAEHHQVPDASNNLGVMYATGLVGKRSNSIAIHHFRKVENFSKLANRNLQIMRNNPGYDFSKSKLLKYQLSFKPISSFEYDPTIVVSDTGNENPYEESIHMSVGNLCFFDENYIDAIAYYRKYIKSSNFDRDGASSLIRECVKRQFLIKKTDSVSPSNLLKTNAANANNLIKDGWMYFYKNSRKQKKFLPKAKECFLEAERLKCAEGHFGVACVEMLEGNDCSNSLIKANRDGYRCTILDVQSCVNKVLGIKKTETREDSAFRKILEESSGEKYEHLYELAMDRYRPAYEELIRLSFIDGGEANYQLGRLMASMSSMDAYKKAAYSFYKKSFEQGYSKACTRMGDVEAILNTEEVCPRCGSRLIVLKGNNGGFFKGCSSRCGYTTHTTTYVSTPKRERTPEELFDHYCKQSRSKVDMRYYNLDDE